MDAVLAEQLPGGLPDLLLIAGPVSEGELPGWERYPECVEGQPDTPIDDEIEGDLLQSSQPVLATLEFDDRCARETADGRVVPARGRRLRATLEVAIDPVHIVDCRIADVTDRRG